MPLDPNIKAMVDLMAASGTPSISTMSVAQARAGMDAMAGMMGPGEEVAEVEDRAIVAGGQTLLVRRYRPAAVAAGPAPTLVFFHGGGFVLGGLRSHDRECRALANRGRCQVVSVDYRLAPEHPFPAAPDDAIASFDFIVANAHELGVDVEHLAVGGDSAGGTLAAVVALHARDASIPLRLQLLIYPGLSGDPADYPSRTEEAAAFMFDRETVQWFTEAYMPDGIPLDWRASPMLADRHVGLAPALIISAEFDPLRDSGEAYGQLLRAAGVPATTTCYDGMIHGFFGMGAITKTADAAIDEAGEALRAAWHDDTAG